MIEFVYCLGPFSLSCSHRNLLTELFLGRGQSWKDNMESDGNQVDLKGKTEENLFPPQIPPSLKSTDSDTTCLFFAQEYFLGISGATCPLSQV